MESLLILSASQSATVALSLNNHLFYIVPPNEVLG
jgi:hypothetical protein